MGKILKSIRKLEILGTCLYYENIGKILILTLVGGERGGDGQPEGGRGDIQHPGGGHPHTSRLTGPGLLLTGTGGHFHLAQGSCS